MGGQEFDRLRPGTSEYAEHMREEIEHYGAVYEADEARQTLVQPVPRSWVEMEARAAALIRAETGNDLYGHVVSRLRQKPDSRMLSLGSGPGGVEIDIAQQIPAAEVTCTDINRDLLALGEQRAQQLGLNFLFLQADLNTVDLPTRAFDVVLCHASLHHVIELEHVAAQIRGTLRDGGVLITVDVVTRNGYRMWPESREAALAIWQTLPPKYRVNHTAYGEPRLDDEMFVPETDLGGMECARSEDILPVLEQSFAVEHFVPYFSLCRRFFDTMYGPNYDLSAPLDSAILNWIWALDRHHLTSGLLQPETFFGVYR